MKKKEKPPRKQITHAELKKAIDQKEEPGIAQRLESVTVLHLTGYDLRDVDFEDLIPRDALIVYADGAMADGTNWSGRLFGGVNTSFGASNFRYASLVKASFKGARFNKSGDFTLADLTNADFTDVFLGKDVNLDFRGANLSGANLPKDMKSVMYDKKTNFAGAVLPEDAIVPRGFDMSRLDAPPVKRVKPTISIPAKPVTCSAGESKTCDKSSEISYC